MDDIKYTSAKSNVLKYDAEKDYGTPKKDSETLVTLNIDGVDVTVPEGTSIMHAAQLGGVTVPKLCATDSLEPFGSCRLCLVEI
jgi:formate dehydrogenase major subunit